MFHLNFAEKDENGNPKNQTFTVVAIIRDKKGLLKEYSHNINTEADVTEIFEDYDQRWDLLYFEAIDVKTGQVIKLK